MKNYRVTYAYHGVVTVDVKAPSPDAAERKGLTEADEVVLGNLSMISATPREVTTHKDRHEAED